MLFAPRRKRARARDGCRHDHANGLPCPKQVLLSTLETRARWPAVEAEELGCLRGCDRAPDQSAQGGAAPPSQRDEVPT